MTFTINFLEKERESLMRTLSSAEHDVTMYERCLKERKDQIEAINEKVMDIDFHIAILKDNIK